MQTSQIEFFDRLPEGAELPRELNPVAIHHLPDALRLDYLDAFGSAIHAVFMLAAGIMVLAFALSFDEIIVTTFTAGHERTLPLWLLNQLGRPRDVPVTNVVALLVMLVTTIPILGAWWLTREGDNSARSGK